MMLTCPNCGGQVPVKGISGRPSLGIGVNNVCDALQRHGSVGAAAVVLGCSRAYIYASLKGAGLKAADVIDRNEKL